ncbi:MAG: putative Glucose-phosphate adenylyltransferase [Bacteroidetes bacterium]|nr:putative Glucose-phosphate adenylyltransferase [Bacteroidota bacterium]
MVFFLLSKMLERMAFYGIRGVLVMYMVHGMEIFSMQDAAKLYGFFIGSVYLSNIIGGVLGDFLTGNKYTALAGSALQILAAISFCFPSEISLYLGLILLSLGSGLNNPNFLAQYGKRFADSPARLDGGMTIWYSVINFGAIIGSFIISVIGNYNYLYGFVLAAFIMSLSVLFLIFTKETKVFPSLAISHSAKGRSIVYIIVAILLGGVFWALYDQCSSGLFELQMTVEKASEQNGLVGNFWQIWGAVCILVSGIVLSLVWSFIYVNSFTKIGIGFLLGALAFCLFALDSDTNTGLNIFVFAGITFLLSVSDLFVAPILSSVIIRHTNPRYLTLIISLSFLPAGFVPPLLGSIIRQADISSFVIEVVGTVLMCFIGTTVIVLSRFWAPKQEVQENELLAEEYKK